MAEQKINVTIVGAFSETLNINVYQSELDEIENKPSIAELKTREYLNGAGIEIPEHNLHFGHVSNRTKFLQQYIVDNDKIDVREEDLSYYYVSKIKYDMNDYFNETWFVGSYYDIESPRYGKSTIHLWDYIPLPFKCKYEFKDKRDLINYECLSNNLTKRMVIDILNGLQCYDYIQIYDDVRTMWINGEYSGGRIIIQYSFEDSAEDYFEYFFDM
jgi:hypothetical protein